MSENNHGGFREGAGRKPTGNAKRPYATKLKPEVIAFLRASDNAAATIEACIMRSKAFHEWKRKNAE